jgi:hypothetical protein
MKKIVLVIALAAILATGTVFAQHSGGLGIGVLWGGDIYNSFAHSAALSLKLPGFPFYWGISVGGFGDVLLIGVQGDKYLFDQVLVKNIGLGWYFGLGGYVNLVLANKPSLSFGARLPIGLSWIPVNFFELFTNFAPSLGISFNPTHFPNITVPLELGIRLWL